MNFKIGDIVTTNPKFDNDFQISIWWNNCKDKSMTIRKIDEDCSIYIKENNYIWDENG